MNIYIVWGFIILISVASTALIVGLWWPFESNGITRVRHDYAAPRIVRRKPILSDWMRLLLAMIAGFVVAVGLGFVIAGWLLGG